MSPQTMNTAETMSAATATMPLASGFGNEQVEPCGGDDQRGRDEQRPRGPAHVVQSPRVQHDARKQQHELDPLAVTARHQEVVEREHREQRDSAPMNWPRGVRPAGFTNRASKFITFSSGFADGQCVPLQDTLVVVDIGQHQQAVERDGRESQEGAREAGGRGSRPRRPRRRKSASPRTAPTAREHRRESARR